MMGLMGANGVPDVVAPLPGGVTLPKTAVNSATATAQGVQQADIPRQQPLSPGAGVSGGGATGGGGFGVLGGGPQNNNNHLFSQISKVVINSATRNVTGIVDEALKIGTPAPVRDLVNGILGVAYCNSIRRLLGRC